ncbi:DUF4157 domain-containing protein [Actinoplanes sp. CA-051413]|uniref:eCIS core domain-containing protein n=1 Tax=Actinoplanes sp. CA-051413 TaxID=3239899 RepID=UPI003D969053
MHEATVGMARAPERRFTASPDPVLMRCGGQSCPPGTCGHDDESQLQRSGAFGPAVASVPPVVHDVLASPGQALDARIATTAGARFGHDFSRVRVHTDAAAAHSARAVNSFAYTVGRDVVFAAGRYDPVSAVGRRLLTHELVHVVQQSAAGRRAGGDLAMGRPDDRSEVEAASAAVSTDLDPGLPPAP